MNNKPFILGLILCLLATTNNRLDSVPLKATRKIKTTAKNNSINRIIAANNAGVATPQNGDLLRTLPGETINSQQTIPAGATVTISGAADFNENIILANSTSTLRLNLQNKLKTNIVLNGGKVILDSDLQIANGFGFLGNGTVDINGMSLKYPKGPLASLSQIQYLNANDITLDGNASISSPQIFSGTGLESNINGHNFFWNFDSGGYIQVNADHTLFLVGLHIKDFGHKPSYGYFDIHATSTIVLQNCTVELTGNYVHDQGSLIFAGDNNKIIHQDYTLTTSGSQAWLYVDGVSVTYDSLDKPNKNCFAFTNIANQLKLVNGGNIRSTYLPPSINVWNANAEITENYMLSNDLKLNLKNENPATQKGVTLNCHGHSLYFPMTGSNLINLDSNMTTTFNNVVLHNFKKNAINYANANNSQVVFGPGTHIRLFEDILIDTNDKPWKFVGDTELSGPGSSLELDASNSLTIESGTLTIRNMYIKFNAIEALKCLSPDAKILLENCTICLQEPGINWNMGNLDIQGIVEIIGGDHTKVDTPTTFTFASTGQMRILSGSKLIIERGIIFKYNANTSADGGSVYLHKRHFKLMDPTSTLELNGAEIHVGSVGMALDYGRMVIDDIVIIKVDGNIFTQNEVELGSSLIFFIRPCAVFDIQGMISYNRTTYP